MRTPKDNSVWIYVRFSPRPTKKGTPPCESCETQIDRCRAWLKARGLEGAAVTVLRDEARSGKSTDGRPGLAQVLDEVCAAKGLLLVYSLSRLARNAKDAFLISARLDQAGANLASATETIDTSTPMGRAVYGIIAIFAQLEREQTGERISDGMLHHQRQGRLMTRAGRCPYGWKANGKGLAPVPSEQAVLKRIGRWAESGADAREIAARLREGCVTERSGARFRARTVERILSRLGP